MPALGHHRGHRQEDLSTFDREETLWSSLHNAGLEAGAQAGEPVARLGAKAAGKWFTGCRRNIVEVEVVGGGTRT